MARDGNRGIYQRMLFPHSLPHIALPICDVCRTKMVIFDVRLCARPEELPSKFLS